MDIITALIPAQYQPFAIAILGIMVAITHLMTLMPATSGIAAKIVSVLNIIAGNYGTAANTFKTPEPPTTNVTILKLIPFALAVGLAVSLCACATQPSSSTWSAGVVTVQATWPIAEGAINADVKTPSAALLNAEAAITADVAQLNATTPPTSLAALSADVTLMVNALPPSTLSAEHKAEVDAFVTAVSHAAALL